MPAEFVQAESETPLDPQAPSLTFYLKGESAARWSERIRLETREIGVGTTPEGVLDILADDIKRTCPSYTEHRFDVPPEDAGVIGLMMWHCPRNAADRGGVGTVKLILGGHRAYVMSAEGDFPAYAEGSTPLLKVQLGRWSTFQNSLALCVDWSTQGCAPPPDAFVESAGIAVSGAEAEAVATAERLGLELYRQDQLAWHGTDTLLARYPLKASSAGGFVAIPGEGRSGRFFLATGKGKRPATVYTVAFDESGTPGPVATMKKLPDDAAARYRVLKAAEKSGFEACAPRINTAVIPDTDGGWLVYLISASSEPGKMFLGGHSRVRVDRRGKILSSEASANTCLMLDVEAWTREIGHVPDGKKAWLVVSHLKSDVPWETHVLQSLTFDVALVVFTADAVWRVQDGRIEKLIARLDG